MKSKLYTVVTIASFLFVSFKSFSQANTTLSNLTSPTTINQDLLPNGNNTLNLGSISNSWRILYIDSSIYLKDSLFINNKGMRNTFVGQRAGYLITTGNNNAAYGFHALYIDRSNSFNSAFGSYALTNNTASFNSAFGYRAMYFNISGTTNAAVGAFALYSNIAGNFNVAIGDSALYNSKSGYNTAIGSEALYGNTTGSYNTALGFHAGVNSSSSNASAISSNAYADCNNCMVLGDSITNVGIGVKSPHAKLQISNGSNFTLTNGGYQIIGDTNNYNIVYDPTGMQARFDDTVSDIYINKFGGSASIGNSNISQSGLSAFGTNVGLYGYASQNNTQGYGVVGYDPVGTGVHGSTEGSNIGVEPHRLAGVYGENEGYGDGVTGYCYYGNGVIGYSMMSYGIYAFTGSSKKTAGYFAGDIYSTGTYQGSDEKLKMNIQDFSSALNIISQIHPKTYNYRQDAEFETMNLPQGLHYGLIAQDVEKTLPNLVKEMKQDVMKIEDHTISSSNKTLKDLKTKEITNTGQTIDFKAINYTELIPIIIKAMQEINASKDSALKQQQSINEKLQNQINELKAMIVSSNNQLTSVSLASLAQNIPNPFSNSTSISYNLPQQYASAKIILTDKKGVVIKQISLQTKGKGNISVDASTLAASAYQYSLYVNGKLIDTKQMLLSR